MKPRSIEAGRLEGDYLDRVRSELTDREPSEIDEISESLREHIEEELSELTDEEVSLGHMADVLEKLGSPDSYREEPKQAAPPPPLPILHPVPAPDATEMEPIRISAFTIINICAIVVHTGVPLFMLPKFGQIFKQMGAELPVITLLVLGIPNLVYVLLVPLGALVLIGKDLLIRSRLASLLINLAVAIFILGVLMTYTVAMFVGLTRLMTGLHE